MADTLERSHSSMEGMSATALSPFTPAFFQSANLNAGLTDARIVDGGDAKTLAPGHVPARTPLPSPRFFLDATSPMAFLSSRCGIYFLSSIRSLRYNGSQSLWPLTLLYIC